MDPITLNRWVAGYSGAIADAARRRKKPCDRFWRTDETNIKVEGTWVYLYRAVNKHGKTLDFMLSERRNKPAVTRFFARTPEVNGLPRNIVLDKSDANTAGIKTINKVLTDFGSTIPIEMVRRKFLNKILEQDRRFIKRKTRPMLSFKRFVSAAAALACIEMSHMIRKGQFAPGLCPSKQFAELAA